jgi:hypothetical protein
MGLSADHKRKISEGLKRYHSTCKGGKKNKDKQKQLQVEVNKLRNLVKKPSRPVRNIPVKTKKSSKPVPLKRD